MSEIVGEELNILKGITNGNTWNFQRGSCNSGTKTSKIATWNYNSVTAIVGTTTVVTAIVWLHRRLQQWKPQQWKWQQWKWHSGDSTVETTTVETATVDYSIPAIFLVEYFAPSSLKSIFLICQLI